MPPMLVEAVHAQTSNLRECGIEVDVFQGINKVPVTERASRTAVNIGDEEPEHIVETVLVQHGNPVRPQLRSIR